MGPRAPGLHSRGAATPALVNDAPIHPDPPAGQFWAGTKARLMHWDLRWYYTCSTVITVDGPIMLSKPF